MSQGEKVIEEQLKTVAGDEEEREEEEEEEIYENDECDDSWKEVVTYFVLILFVIF